jgi:hypothetical protein
MKGMQLAEQVALAGPDRWMIIRDENKEGRLKLIISILALILAAAAKGR